MNLPFVMILLHVVVFWVVTPCCGVEYQSFGAPCRLHLQSGENGSPMILRNVAILQQHYTASQPKRPWLVYSSQ